MPRKQKVQQSHIDLPDLPSSIWAEIFQLADLRPPSGTRSLSRVFRQAVDLGAVLNLLIDYRPLGPAAAVAAAAASDTDEEDEEDEEEEEEEEADDGRKSLSSLVNLLKQQKQLCRLNINFSDSLTYLPQGITPLLAVGQAIATELAASPNITKLSLIGDEYEDFPGDGVGAILRGASGVRSLLIRRVAADSFPTPASLLALTALQTLDMQYTSSLDFAAPLVHLQALSIDYIVSETALTFSALPSQLTALGFTCANHIQFNALGSLKQLRELDMKFAQTACVAELAGLTLLTSLRLLCTHAVTEQEHESLSSLSKLVNLRDLRVSNFGNSNVSFLTCLTALKHLDLDRLPTQFSVTASTTLESLAVSDQDFAAAPNSLALLCTLRSLRSLDLRYTTGLGGMQGLALTALTGLTALNLLKCGARKECVRAMRQSLTQLVILDVRQCRGVPKSWSVGVWEDELYPMRKYIDSHMVV